MPNLPYKGFYSRGDTADIALLNAPSIKELDGQRLTVLQAQRAVDGFYNALDGMPVFLAELCNICDTFRHCSVSPAWTRGGVPDDAADPDELISLQLLPNHQLLIFSIVLRVADASSLSTDSSDMKTISASCLKTTLQNQWMLGPNSENAVPLALATAYCLVSF